MESTVELRDLAVFREIVERGSLAAAARALGRSPTTVSERLASLEDHYGSVLLQRTTRSMHLTEEGRLVLDGARRLLDEARELDTRVRLGAEALSGPVRVSAPLDLGRSVVAGVVDRFLAEHPATRVELILSDGYVGLVEEGIDLAVRFGDLDDSTLRRRHLGRFRRVVCAAPSYLEAAPTLESPADLAAHNCLVMRFGPSLDHRWRFKGDCTVAVHGDRVANDGLQVHRWCLAGFGLAYKSELDVRGQLLSGALVECLADHAAPPVPLQLLLPPRQAQPRRVEALADALVQAFGSTNADR